MQTRDKVYDLCAEVIKQGVQRGWKSWKSWKKGVFSKNGWKSWKTYANSTARLEKLEKVFDHKCFLLSV
jgi:hypothetical protein